MTTKTKSKPPSSVDVPVIKISEEHARHLCDLAGFDRSTDPDETKRARMLAAFNEILPPLWHGITWAAVKPQDAHLRANLEEVAKCANALNEALRYWNKADQVLQQSQGANIDVDRLQADLMRLEAYARRRTASIGAASGRGAHTKSIADARDRATRLLQQMFVGWAEIEPERDDIAGAMKILTGYLPPL